MKKTLLLIIAVVAFTCVSNAQIVKSNSVKRTVTTEKVEKPQSESMWYMRLGLNMMKFKGDDFVSDEKYSKSVLGYNWVLGFEKPLGPLFWGMEFGLGSRGYKISVDKYEQKLFAHNTIFSPFNVGYKYPVSDNLAVEGHLGAFIRVDYFGKVHEEDGRDEEDWTIYDTEGDYMFPDAGMQFGFGLWFNNIGVDLCWQKGFINLFEDVDCKSSNFMLRLGVAF